MKIHLSEIDMADANVRLRASHYLGASRRGFALACEGGVMVFANPSSRRLPQQTWLELVRWCITSEEKNFGSQMFKAAVAVLKKSRPQVSTLISYSDPSTGHNGALYRGCNWCWAPTWLRPPPSANGNWGSDKKAAVKDRWFYPLRPEIRRHLLEVNDVSILRKCPWARFDEKVGVRYRKI